MAAMKMVRMAGFEMLSGTPPPSIAEVKAVMPQADPHFGEDQHDEAHESPAAEVRS